MGCLFVLISAYGFVPVLVGVLKRRLEIFCKWANTPCDKTSLAHINDMPSITSRTHYRLPAD